MIEALDKVQTSLTVLRLPRAHTVKQNRLQMNHVLDCCLGTMPRKQWQTHSRLDLVGCRVGKLFD